MDGLVELVQRGDGESPAPDVQEYVKTNIERVIADWSYVANTSSVGKFGTYTLTLVSVLKSKDLHKDVKKDVCARILRSELKSVYRALTLYKEAQTVPAIALLEQIAIYSANDVCNLFDFTLKVVPRLLTNPPYRPAFLNFYITTIRHASSPSRRELLSNRKIFGSWIGKLSAEDGEALIVRSFEALKTCVLKDTQVFSKGAKMGIFNDWTLKNMVKILSNNPSDAAVFEVSSFIVQLLCDSTYGVRVLDGDDRLALSFLKIIKPWENTAQMDLVLRLLHELPGVRSAYFEALALSYPLTPKASMWWFSYTVLHIRTLKLPVMFGSVQPTVKEALELVLPATVTKSALRQSLQFPDNNLIRFQAAQIALFLLRRLRAVVKEYISRNWNSTVLIEAVLAVLPELTLFSKSCAPQLLQAVFLKIVNEVCRLKPLNLALPFTLEAKDVRSVELVIQQDILEIQTYTAEQMKWWSPVRDQHSLFTQLLVFADHNRGQTDKCAQLLAYLAEPTQMFSELETLAPFASALMYTLQTSEFTSDLAYRLVDQAVARAVSMPYQYIDMVPNMKVSPLILALFDQYSHFHNEDDNAKVLRWLLRLGRAFEVLGEDCRKVHELFSVVEEPEFCTSECFDFLVAAPDSAVLKRTDLALKISNELELSAALYRAATTNNERVRVFLLANVPADLLNLLTRPPAFRQFMRADCLPQFLSALGSLTSAELVDALQTSDLWYLGLSFESNDFLIEKLMQTKNAQILNELTVRKVPVPQECVTNLLGLDNLADNLDLMEPLSLTFDPILYSECRDSRLVCSLVRASGAIPTDVNLDILASIARYVPSELPAGALEAAAAAITSGKSAGISIAAKFPSLPAEIWSSISSYIESGKADAKTSVLKTEFIAVARLAVTEAPSVLSLWLKVTVHQLTRRYLNKKVGGDMIEFLTDFNKGVLGSLDIFKEVNSNSLRALMEAAVNYDAHPQSYELVSRLNLWSKKSKHYSKDHALRVLSSLLEKPFENDVTTCLLLLSLFDETSCATREVQDTVLTWYGGSQSPQDLILLQILKLLESSRQRSWVDEVESWDIRPSSALRAPDEYEQDPLIMLRDRKLYVTLDELRIRKTIQCFEPTKDLSLVGSGNYDTWLLNLEKYGLRAPKEAHVLYSHEFLLNAIISCGQLDDDVDSLIQSGLLSFALCAVVDPLIAEDAQRYLMHTFELTGKTQTVSKAAAPFRLIIGKLLMARELHDVPPHMPLFLGSIAQVIAKPGHFMYEKVSEWLLSSPQLRIREVPLFQSILESQSDLKTRELVWYIDTLNASITDDATVQLYESLGVVDWCLSQRQLAPAMHHGLRASVLKLLEKVIEIKGAARVLMEGAGALAVADIRQRLAYAAGSKCIANWTSIEAGYL